jgi:hypothetical protein
MRYMCPSGGPCVCARSASSSGSDLLDAGVCTYPPASLMCGARMHSHAHTHTHTRTHTTGVRTWWERPDPSVVVPCGRYGY